MRVEGRTSRCEGCQSSSSSGIGLIFYNGINILSKNVLNQKCMMTCAYSRGNRDNQIEYNSYILMQPSESVQQPHSNVTQTRQQDG